ncbi:MAG: isoprenylcysteine carboxylmethyltransferase family protein [Candidatus Marinimicrobia bacterium]|nr:isoprenylcysteine carboxylmethyltransferase family protein [Candidatus Neomarinimicrobiota bacterium]
MEKNNDKGAGVKFPPPIVQLIWIIIGFTIQNYKPISLGFNQMAQYLGLLIIGIGISLLLHIHQKFKNAKTNIKPRKPTTNIITTGIYAYSRNPIYLAFNFFSIGLGVFYDNIWVLISIFPSMTFIYFIAIKKEEKYLEKIFGNEYIEYKKSVRRWV